MEAVIENQREEGQLSDLISISNRSYSNLLQEMCFNLEKLPQGEFCAASSQHRLVITPKQLKTLLAQGLKQSGWRLASFKKIINVNVCSEYL